MRANLPSVRPQGLQIALPSVLSGLHRPERGRSSGVEHNLAKVGVEGSNPFARSSFFPGISRRYLKAPSVQGTAKPVRSMPFYCQLSGVTPAAVTALCFAFIG